MASLNVFGFFSFLNLCISILAFFSFTTLIIFSHWNKISADGMLESYLLI